MALPKTGLLGKESNSASGTSDFTLTGAKTDFRTLIDAIGGTGGVSIYYIARNGSEIEEGIGTLSAGGGSLTRDTILRSSNSNAKVNFSAAPDVYSAMPSTEEFPLLCILKRAATVSIASGSLTDVEFDTVDLDIFDADGGGGWDDVGGTNPERISVPHKGVFRLTVFAVLAESGTHNLFYVKIARFNSSDVEQESVIGGEMGQANSTAVDSQLHVSDMFECDAGDYFKIQVFQNTGSAINLTSARATAKRVRRLV